MAETLPDLVLSPREKKTITLDSDTLFQNKNIRSGITIDGDVFGEGEIILVPAGSVEVENYGWTHAFVSMTSVVSVPAIPATNVEVGTSTPIIIGTVNNPALSYEVTPSNATQFTRAWSSTATDKITFNANGSFNIIGNPGSIPVTLTLTNKDGSQVTGTSILTSVEATGTADDIPTIAPGATHQVAYGFAPATPAGETSYVFNSTAPAIASISNTGLITAHAEGTTTITIARQFRGSTTIITKSVTVAVAPVAVPMTDVYLNSIPRAIVGTVNNPAVEFTFEPSDASGYTVAYTAEGTADVVTVHPDGKFDVLQDVGGAYIRVTITNADGTTCTDRSGVQTTTLDVATASTSAINVGQTYQLVYTVDPIPDSDAVYEFTTTDPLVATIDSNGLATGTGDGFCRIGLTVHYRGMSSSDSSGFTVNAV